MKRWPHVFLLLASTATVGSSARTVSPAEEPKPPSSTDAADPAATSDTDETADARDDAGTTPAAMRLPSISLSGGMNCVLSSKGEASTTWRHGRQNSGRSVNETTYRVAVTGVAACEGRTVEFSTALFVPALRVGAYTLQSGDVVAVWARSDRSVAKPDIEWDASARGAGRVRLALTVASITEASRRYDWRDGVAIDVRNFAIEGTLHASIPCAQSIPALRQACHSETLAGTF